MPNRIIKESIKLDAKIDTLSWFDEVVFYRLIVSADDYGCLDGRIIVLRNELFPTKDNITRKAIEDALQHLVNADLLRRYEVSGQPYLFFPTWEKHQRVRNKVRKYPEPPADIVSAPAEAPSPAGGDPAPDSTEPEPESGTEPVVRKEKTPLEEAMERFRKHRKAIRKPLTEDAYRLTLKKLEELAPGDEQQQIAIIDQSIQRGWNGVFPLNYNAIPSAKKTTKASDPALEGDDLERWIDDLEMAEKMFARQSDNQGESHATEAIVPG